MQYGFYFDSSRCTGCKTCEIACKDYHDLGPELLLRRVYDVEGGSWSQDENGAWRTTAFVYHVSNACNHCDSPACFAACGSGAVVKDSETGLVSIDPDSCTGCGLCREACPYDAPRIDEASGVAKKCDGCASRVADGLAPICVDACVLRCLEFGDIEELRAEHGIDADIAPLPSSEETSPNLVVNVCAPALAASENEAHVANELEVA